MVALGRFYYVPNIKFHKNLPDRAELIHVDRQSDRHDAQGRFS